jgi:hypothetical protein
MILSFQIPAKMLGYVAREGARGRVVGSGNMLQAGRSRFRFPIRSLIFSIHVILLVAL